MTRVDERGAPIVVGEAERAGLARYFAEQPDVVAAYLFGSQARGTPGPLSDVDLAVWLDTSLDGRRRFSRQLSLMSGAGDVLGTSEAQVVVLDDAPPLLAHRVLRDGFLLTERDPVARVHLETDTIVRYLDTIPLRQELSRGLARRLGLEPDG